MSNYDFRPKRIFDANMPTTGEPNIGPFSLRGSKVFSLQMVYDATVTATFVFQGSNSPRVQLADGTEDSNADWTTIAGVTIPAATGSATTQMVEVVDAAYAWGRIVPDATVAGNIACNLMRKA